jgi:putative Mn2+ efflux pump MntP
MDAFAVSIASGITIRQLHVRHALTIATWFGVFQAVMPLLGWLGGVTLNQWVSGVDHWIAFVLLAVIGGKMIYEAFKIEEVEEKNNPLDVYVLFVLSVATSIDAFAVGLSLAMLKVKILRPVLIIGGITFAVSFAGVYLGRRIGHFFEKKIEVVGGLTLIGIGVKILADHLLAG